jgi:two-component system chemotaxis response regulator CheY
VKTKLLLVDDSALARRSLRAILEPEGFDVVEAEDGMVALERYFLDRPDVVMLDLDPTARVIVVSADVQSSSMQLVEEAGASGFINKPFERERLLSTVRQVLERPM